MKNVKLLSDLSIELGGEQFLNLWTILRISL
jgi:hypothetical protein